MTKRQVRRLHAQAKQCWINGQHHQMGYVVAAPGKGALRLAFDAGIAAEKQRKIKFDAGQACSGSDLPLDLWVRVLAETVRERAIAR